MTRLLLMITDEMALEDVSATHSWLGWHIDRVRHAGGLACEAGEQQPAEQASRPQHVVLISFIIGVAGFIVLILCAVGECQPL